jgi:hypothetical protein
VTNSSSLLNTHVIAIKATKSLAQATWKGYKHKKLIKHHMYLLLGPSSHPFKQNESCMTKLHMKLNKGHHFMMKGFVTTWAI